MCARQLAAIKMLGWRTVSVVRSASGRLGHLLPSKTTTYPPKTTPVEAAAPLPRAEDPHGRGCRAAGVATRFSAENQLGASAGAPHRPNLWAVPATRRRDGSWRRVVQDALETDYLRQVTDDPEFATARPHAAAELERIDAGAPVHPGSSASAPSPRPQAGTTDLEALQRPSPARRRHRLKPAPVTSRARPSLHGGRCARVRRHLSELADWWTHYDAEVLANGSTSDEQIASFLATADGTSTFADDLRTARQALSNPRRHLRALDPSSGARTAHLGS